MSVCVFTAVPQVATGGRKSAAALLQQVTPTVLGLTQPTLKQKSKKKAKIQLQMQCMRC